MYNNDCILLLFGSEHQTVNAMDLSHMFSWQDEEPSNPYSLEKWPGACYY